MMLRRTIIGFDDDPDKDDIVTFAVAPIDVLTGRIVKHNVTANVTVASDAVGSEAMALPDKPIRNLSGLLVFIKLPEHPKYQVHLQARAAGYFDPDPADFTPPERSGEENASDLKDLLQINFILFPRPDFAFDEEATLISGVVVRGKIAVKSARISVIVTEDERIANPRSAQTFETRSDERGAFALALRLPAFSVNEINGAVGDGLVNGVSVEFKIAIRDEDDEWKQKVEWDLEIVEGSRLVFELPIDLGNPNDQISLTI